MLLSSGCISMATVALFLVMNPIFWFRGNSWSVQFLYSFKTHRLRVFSRSKAEKITSFQRLYGRNQLVRSHGTSKHALASSSTRSVQHIFNWKNQYLITNFLQQIIGSKNREVLPMEGLFALNDHDGDVVVVDASRDILATLSGSIRQDEKTGKFYYQYFLSCDGSVRELPVEKIRLQTFVESPSETLLIDNLEHAVDSMSPILSPSYRLDVGTIQCNNDHEGCPDLPTREFSKVSPFSQEQLVGSQDQILPSNNMTFSREAVDLVLDQVRPFLMADGGNVAVVDIDLEKKIVQLSLQGACSSCASSTTTMKMGIERALKIAFPDLQDVVAVNSPTGSPSLTYLDHDGITFTEVEESLAALAPAIKHLEGSLEVVAVDSIERKVTIRFSGPQKLKLAIEGSLLDHPKVDSVEFLYV